MHLDEFQLRTASFEIRYDSAFAIWDRAGRLWTTLHREFPTIALSQATPNEVTVQDADWRLSVGLTKAYIMAFWPDSLLGDFPDKATTFTGIVSDTLELAAFTRIGFRAVFTKSFSDKKAASAAMLELDLLRVPEGKNFGIDDAEWHLPEYSIRMENEALGCLVRIKAHEFTISVDPIPEMPRGEMQTIKETKHELVFDLDYYTTATVLISQIRVADWLAQVFHGIRRDSKNYLGR